MYGSIKESLLKLQESHPSLKAMCMGTRRTDPHTGEEVLQFANGGRWIRTQMEVLSL